MFFGLMDNICPEWQSLWIGAIMEKGFAAACSINMPIASGLT